MAEPLNLSQPAWTVVDMLQEQLGVTIEVLDSSMRPHRGAEGAEVSSATEEPRIAEETLKSLRTGELRIDRTTGAPVGIFPLRVGRQVAGCLVVSARATAAGETRVAPDVEGAGHLARTALEADLTLTTQLGDARYRNRRVHGILRFLSQLGGDASEREVMNAVIQAGTVWFDVDCRIYHRQPGGSFLLAAVLPGVEQRPTAPHLDKARVDKLVSSRRFPSGGDLDDLGLVGRREEVLVLPVGPPSLPEWLLILAGTIDQEVDLTFSAIAKILAGELMVREAKRVEAWQDLLARSADDSRQAAERTLLVLLGALVREVDAGTARVTLLRGKSERVLATLGSGQPPAQAETRPKAERAEMLSYVVSVAPDVAVRLDISTAGDARHAALQASSWIKALRPWLREGAAGMTTEAPLFETAVAGSPFEQRIQEEVERAKRFNLGLGLVLIKPGQGPSGEAAMEPLLDAIRSELRASDLMGRIRGDLVAVLLVHAEPIGAASVTTRLQRRLGRLPAEARLKVVQLGRAVFSAECASADALIAKALREAVRFELRN